MNTTINTFENSQVVHAAYDSIADLCAAQVSAINQAATAGRAVVPGAEYETGSAPSWYGMDRREIQKHLGKDRAINAGAIYALAEKYITAGWTKGAEKAREMSAQLPVISGATSIRKRRVFSDSGDSIRPEALSGSVSLDRAWITSRRNKRVSGTAQRTINIYFGDNCNITQEQIFWNGIAGAVLANKLEDAGYQVEIRAVSMAANEYYDESGAALYGAQSIILKRHDEALDLDRLITAVGHAGFFRSFGFKAIMSANYRTAGDLGSSVPGKAKTFFGMDEQSVFVAKVYSREAAVEYLMAALKGYQ